MWQTIQAQNLFVNDRFKIGSSPIVLTCVNEPRHKFHNGLDVVNIDVKYRANNKEKNKMATMSREAFVTVWHTS